MVPRHNYNKSSNKQLKKLMRANKILQLLQRSKQKLMIIKNIKTESQFTYVFRYQLASVYFGLAISVRLFSERSICLCSLQFQSLWEKLRWSMSRTNSHKKLRKGVLQWLGDGSLSLLDSVSYTCVGLYINHSSQQLCPSSYHFSP